MSSIVPFGTRRCCAVHRCLASTRRWRHLTGNEGPRSGKAANDANPIGIRATHASDRGGVGFLWAENSAPAEAGTTGETGGCTNEFLKGGYGTIGTGALVGVDVGAITTMVFDGAGKMSGHGTAVFDRPALPFRFEIQNATYALKDDCTGTMSWYAHFPDLDQVDHSTPRHRRDRWREAVHVHLHVDDVRSRSTDGPVRGPDRLGSPHVTGSLASFVAAIVDGLQPVDIRGSLVPRSATNRVMGDG
jgi:hypothetical protein